VLVIMSDMYRIAIYFNDICKVISFICYSKGKYICVRVGIMIKNV